MNHHGFMLVLPLLFTVKISLCQNCISTTSRTLNKNDYQEITMYDSIPHNDFCSYFYSKDTLIDTLHFNFEDREDFGPVYLSNNELKQIYCEIKRGNIEAYEVLCLHFFYSHSQRYNLDKLICITDFLALKYNYYKGYWICGNIIFDNLGYNTDDFYSATLIKYYEKYFEYSKSKSVAKKLYEIYCGNYSFHDVNLIKAKYYEEFIYDK